MTPPMTKDAPLTRATLVKTTIITCSIYFGLALIFGCNCMQQFIPKVGTMMSFWATLVLLGAGVYSAAQSFMMIKNKRVQ